LTYELENEYKDVNETFGDLQRKIITETHSNEDLEKYVKALDQYVTNTEINIKSDHEIPHTENG